TRAAPPLSLALRPRAPRPTPFPYTTLFRSAAIEAKQFRSHLQFTNKIMVPIRKYAYSRLGIDILNQTEGAVCFKIESSYGPQVGYPFRAQLGKQPFPGDPRPLH